MKSSFLLAWLLALTLALTAVIAYLAWMAWKARVHVRRRLAKASSASHASASGSCSATSCGAIDPVNDPDYNMREVIKNTVLIEQHLSEPNKYCRQCIVKHFLISIALLEEAEWMAGAKRDSFPMLGDSLPFYRGAFDEWFAHTEDVGVRMAVLEKLRSWRRDASELYFPTDAAPAGGFT